MRVLFLDDDSSRHDGFKRLVTGAKHVYTAKQAIAELDRYRYDLVCLDHDLKSEHIDAANASFLMEDTGLSVCIHMRSLPEERRPKYVVVHSWNPVGGARMVRELVDADFVVYRIPFSVNSIKDFLEHL